MDPEVAGSNPAGGTISKIFLNVVEYIRFSGVSIIALQAFVVTRSVYYNPNYDIRRAPLVFRQRAAQQGLTETKLTEQLISNQA